MGRVGRAVLAVVMVGLVLLGLQGRRTVHDVADVAAPAPAPTGAGAAAADNSASRRADSAAAAVGAGDAFLLSPDGTLRVDAGPQPNCSIWIDRHNVKTGGTTMRNIMLAHQAAGRCLYWGYSPQHGNWIGLLKYLETQPLSASTLLRLCIELHFPVDYFAGSVPQLSRLRAALAPRGCRLTLSTRVREPFAFYWSYYKWAVMGRQLAAWQCERMMRAPADQTEPSAVRARVRGRRLLVRCEAAGPDEPVALARRWRWGRNFTDWASSAHDLQSQTLLRAGIGWCVDYPPYEGSEPLPACRHWNAFSEQDGKALRSALRAFDHVGDAAAVEEHALLVRARTGLPPARVTRAAPSAKHHAGWPGQPTPPAVTLAEACPDKAACRALVARIAPSDATLWSHFGGGRAAGAVEAALGPRARIDAAVARARREQRAEDALELAMTEYTSAPRRARARNGTECARRSARYKPHVRPALQGTRACRQVKLGAPSAGGTPCMPVPRAIAKLWQDDASPFGRAAHFAGKGVDYGAQPREMVAVPAAGAPGDPLVCHWRAFAAEHAELVREAELPAEPFVCTATAGAAARDGHASSGAAAPTAPAQLADEAHYQRAGEHAAEHADWRKVTRKVAALANSSCPASTASS